MAFHGHQHLFKPQTVLTLKSLKPALLLHTQPPYIVPSTQRSSHVHYVVSPRTNNSNTSDALLARRSANYHRNIWDYKFVESLTSDYKSEICVNRAEKLKDNIRGMFDGASGIPYPLKLINTLQRLGLDYHFHNEIKSALDKISIKGKDGHVSQNDLTTKALKFRLFRQHGYEISQGIAKDFEGLLSLYEASYYACEGEEILNEARQVTSKHLKNCLKERNDNRSSMSIFLEEEVGHSLELPLLCRVPRMEHEDLKYASRWWRELALDESLGFARNRLVETFLWISGFSSEPKFGNVRRQVTKIAYIATVIDDVYDVYGSLDELKIFTEAVEMWDINTVENLPHYMKICFFALYNTVNEKGYEVLRNNNLDVMPYLKKSWEDICKAYLVEATWYYSGQIPTLEEYTNNAWITIAGPLVGIHAYSLEYMNNNHSYLIRWSSMIFRLADDLATSKDELERGDVAKSIQCYMHETGASESIAREHVQHMIRALWEKMNASLSASHGVFPSSFVNSIQNIAKMAQYMYQYGNGYGIPNREAKDRIMSVIVEPIPV
ncbi:hypothetical protein MKW98_001473 [Papaver atlanticum]|uniref:Uncharacterized protein n=1 Tax=Papaver atlanticum TaxID=357466 RepID=A0AAD4XK51_9MAGN|nr:hypothetical protein MKW98_001473 [Papaver atlanticum]